ncbi:MAG: hypothetical protein RL701_2065 [Pseudomonadota bacterium]
MHRQLTRLLGLALGVAAAGCELFGGAVEHPKPGDSNSVGYCGKSAPEENNCMACSSKPGCGWCASPVAQAPACQPGTRGHAQPDTCQVALTIGNEECVAPPPPPPEE